MPAQNARTLNQAANYLKLSPKTFREWRARGHIPAPDLVMQPQGWHCWLESTLDEVRSTAKHRAHVADRGDYT